jgi:ribosome maturation factor RimP
MDREAIIGRIEGLVLPLVERAGLELFAVHYRSEQGRMVVRLVVDLPDGGVTLDTLASLSRQVGHVLDVGEVVPGRYHLECASPGVERPLLRPRHFVRAVGSRVRVRTTEASGLRRRLRGDLTEADDFGVTVVDDEAGPQRVPFDAIAEARLEFDARQALARQARR